MRVHAGDALAVEQVRSPRRAELGEEVVVARVDRDVDVGEDRRGRALDVLVGGARADPGGLHRGDRRGVARSASQPRPAASARPPAGPSRPSCSAVEVGLQRRLHRARDHVLLSSVGSSVAATTGGRRGRGSRGQQRATREAFSGRPVALMTLASERLDEGSSSAAIGGDERVERRDAAVRLRARAGVGADRLLDRRRAAVVHEHAVEAQPDERRRAPVAPGRLALRPCRRPSASPMSCSSRSV